MDERVEKLVLGWADYSVIGACLCLSAGIGVYFNRRQAGKTADDFLLAGRDMAALPVAASLLATFMSSTNYMGLPADVYLRGTHMAFMNVGFVTGAIVSAYVFLPVFFNNGFVTAYEYLEKRFGKSVRMLTSAMFAIQSALYSAVALYAPALALSAVTDLSQSVSLVAMGAVCTLYCTLGGMKAVLWTDVFQSSLMYSTLFAVTIVGSISLGGPGNIFRIARDGGRLLVPSFRFDLTKQYTMYNIFSQGLIISLSMLTSQLSVQRFMAVKSVKRARRANLSFIPLVVVFQLMSCACGLTIYAYFKECDPISTRAIHSADQLLPFFVSRAMSSVPGLAGLCCAGVFSASLSTVSSSVNSLTAVTLRDFLPPNFSARRPLLCTQITSLVFGCVCVGLSFAASASSPGTNLIQMSLTVLGLFAGPNLAVFLLAATTRTANTQGVVIGLVLSLSAGVMLVCNPDRRLDPPLPVSNECPANVTTSHILPPPPLQNNVTAFQDAEQPFFVSYMWISGIELIICVVVGYFGSMAINCLRGKTAEVPDIYLAPARTWFTKKEIVPNNKTTTFTMTASNHKYVFSSLSVNDSNS